MRNFGLEELIDALDAEDVREAEFVDRFRRLLVLGEVVLDRSHFDPGHVTASAFVLHPELSSIALIHHTKLDIWVQPGGHIELGDRSHLGATLREASEELGLTELENLGVFDLDIHEIPAGRGEPRHLHFDLRWAIRACTERIIVGEGATDVRWVSIEDALQLDVSVARPVRKLLTKLGAD